MRGPWLVALLGLSIGCGDRAARVEPEPPPPSCSEPELALPGGQCIRPGVLPDGCAQGFVHDGVYGCEPVLPAEPCPPGRMAVPGDEACRPIMECGDGKWGNLPVDASTQYVDGAYGGGDSDGSVDKPWTTVGEGVVAAAPGAVVAVAEGSYGERVVLNKPVRVWGVCPERVSIVTGGPPPSASCPLAAVCVVTGADGAEVGGLSLTGTGMGLAMSGAEDVLVDRVWVHDNGGRGIDVEGTLGSTSMELRGSLVENNHELGVLVSHAVVEVDASVVRATQPLALDQSAGRGISIRLSCTATPTGQLCDPTTRSTASVIGSLVEQNRDAGIAVIGSDAVIDGTVVRTTLPRAVDDDTGRGIVIQPSCSDVGGGLQCDPTTASTATVSRSLVEQNHEMGVTIGGSVATIDSTVVRGTLPRALDQRAGRGISAQLACVELPTGTSCDPASGTTVEVRASLVEDNHEVGVLVAGSNMTMDATVVRETKPGASEQLAGFGISFQSACQEASDGVITCNESARATGTVQRSLVEDNHDTGLLVAGSDMLLDASVIRSTLVHPIDGLYGDGMTVLTGSETTASAVITESRIEDNPRAGVASFGSSVSLSGTSVRCAAFALEGESHLGSDFMFMDSGMNQCGCPAANDPCAVVTAGLTPPKPLPGH